MTEERDGPPGSHYEDRVLVPICSNEGRPHIVMAVGSTSITARIVSAICGEGRDVETGIVKLIICTFCNY